MCRFRQIWCLSMLVCIAPLLSGCTSTPPGFVSKGWGENFEELGLYPKFPPEEDMKVGDVFLLPRDPLLLKDPQRQNSRLPRYGLLLGTVVTPAEVDRYMVARYSYENIFSPIAPSAGSSDKTPADAGTRIVPQAMRRVAMPEFFRVTVAGANVAAVIPADALTNKVGLGLSKIDYASISVDDVGSTSLPLSQVLPKLVDANGKFLVGALGASGLVDAGAILKQLASEYSDETVEIFLVTQVYYARIFTITLHGENAASLNLNDDGSVRNTTPATGQGATASPPQPGNVQPVVDTKGALAEIQPGSFPSRGYVLRVGIAQQGHVGLVKTYDRYVAIGYRGVGLRVDSDMTAFVENKSSRPVSGGVLYEGQGMPKERTSGDARK